MQKFKKRFGTLLAGACAGAVNGLFGAGGGMVLVPLLTHLTDLPEKNIFPASVSIILPICVVSLLVSFRPDPDIWLKALPYLISGGAGGVAAGLFGKKIPVQWLHRILGILILWGGIRYLC